MDKLQALLNRTTNQGGPTALSIVGMTHDSPDLSDDFGDLPVPPSLAHTSIGRDEQKVIDENEKNQNQGRPQFRRAPDFKDLTRTIKHAIKTANSPDPQDPTEPIDPDYTQADDSQPAQQKQSDDQLPTWFHQLNAQHQQSQERQEQLARENQKMGQYLQQFSNTVMQKINTPQAAPPAVPDNLHEQFGLADNSALQELTRRIESSVEQRVRQQYEPMFYQQGRGSFENALSKVQSRPGFNDYFEADGWRQSFDNVVRQHGIQYATSINWEKEMVQAYKVARFDYLEAEEAKRAEAAQKAASKQDKQKEEQKSKMALVPKATHQGSSGQRPSLQKSLEELPSRLSFRNFGREIIRLKQG